MNCYKINKVLIIAELSNFFKVNLIKFDRIIKKFKLLNFFLKLILLLQLYSFQKIFNFFTFFLNFFYF